MSRPQWLACDNGVRKKPMEERGPKLIIEITQPQTTSTNGVRHWLNEDVLAVCTAISSPLFQALKGERWQPI
jgi:hypothetical protein